MSKGNLVPFDNEAFERELDRMGLTKKKVCDGCGYARNYVSQSAARGCISKQFAKVAEIKFGIDPETYTNGVPQTPGPAKEDGNMVRNINIEFIGHKLRELGISHTALCKRLGHNDNFFGNMRVNGVTRKDLETIAQFIGVSIQDEQLYKKDEPMDEESKQQVGLEIHKLRSEVAMLKIRIVALENLLEEQTKRQEGNTRLTSSIVTALNRAGVQVGKNA